MREYKTKPENTTEVPDVFKLVSEEASSEDLARQIIKDFYDPDQKEALFLGLQELQMRGNEGLAVFNFLANGKDSMAIIASKLRDNISMKSEELEKLLGIHRMNHVDDFEILEHSSRQAIDEHHREMFNHMKETGALKDGSNYSDFLDNLQFETRTDRTINRPPQLDGSIDYRIENFHFTFGVLEPSYLELIGPREILRLRQTPDVKFLLLGSLGVYSVREAKAYADKINSDINLNVIEIHPRVIKKLKNDAVKKKEKEEEYLINGIVHGDALQLPFKEESHDHIYTNFIFHCLQGGNHPEALSDLFEQVFRCLKPGGSFIIAEKPYGKYTEAEKVEAIKKMHQELESLGLRAGFTLSESLNRTFKYSLRSEVSSAQIDEFGFPQYGDAWVEKTPRHLICKRFIKKDK